MLISLMAGHTPSGAALCAVDYKGERPSNPVYRSFITSIGAAFFLKYTAFRNMIDRLFPESFFLCHLNENSPLLNYFLKYSLLLAACKNNSFGFLLYDSERQLEEDNTFRRFFE